MNYGHPLGQIHSEKARGSCPARKHETCIRARESGADAAAFDGPPLVEEIRKGIVAPVLEKIGIGPQAVLSENLYKEIEKLPKVSGSGGARLTAGDVVARSTRCWNSLSKKRPRLRTNTFSTEHMLLALADQKKDPAQTLLARFGATHDAILKALTAVRGSQRITDRESSKRSTEALERCMLAT